MAIDRLQVFALSASQPLGQSIAEHLGIQLGEHEEREFEDGEHKIRPLQNVRGADVFVLHSLFGDAAQTVNDKLIRLLFFIGALKDAGAEKVTAVMPYLCYARKDRKTKSRDPVNTRYVAALLESVGTDRVVALDVHNLAAYQNAFRCPTDHLEANKLFVEYFASRFADKPLVVVSPDVGGVKRAEQFRQAISKQLDKNIGSAFMEKQRSDNIVSGDSVVGDVADKVAIIVDDIVAGGTTLARTAQACHERGATKVYAATTHGLFVNDANHKLATSTLNQLLITNSVPPFRLTSDAVCEKLTILDVAPLFAEAIKRMHSGGSLVELLSI